MISCLFLLTTVMHSYYSIVIVVVVGTMNFATMRERNTTMLLLEMSLYYSAYKRFTTVRDV